MRPGYCSRHPSRANHSRLLERAVYVGRGKKRQWLHERQAGRGCQRTRRLHAARELTEAAGLAATMATEYLSYSALEWSGGENFRRTCRQRATEQLSGRAAPSRHTLAAGASGVCWPPGNGGGYMNGKQAAAVSEPGGYTRHGS